MLAIPSWGQIGHSCSRAMFAQLVHAAMQVLEPGALAVQCGLKLCMETMLSSFLCKAHRWCSPLSTAGHVCALELLHGKQGGKVSTGKYFNLRGQWGQAVHLELVNLFTLKSQRKVMRSHYYSLEIFSAPLNLFCIPRCLQFSMCIWYVFLCLYLVCI